MCYNRRRGENFTRASVTISEKKWYGVNDNVINLNMGRSAILILVMLNSCSSN